MQIYDINLTELKPYTNNPRLNDDAVKYVKKSIEDFGFKVPLVIDKNNVIVTGHTRYKACKELGYETVPCIRADDLTDEQIKAFRIADNAVGEIATWDNEKLELELQELNIDMSDFNVEMPEIDLEIPIEYGNERDRTWKAYNMPLSYEVEKTDDFWQMPIIHKEDFIPTDLIGFHYAAQSENKKCGIHCYVDDYRFERIWNRPDQYVNLLKKYECFLSPDFSLYMDMDEPVKIWNVYRSRLIGAYYQSEGVRVIPTLQWAGDETFDYCFKGIEKGGVVSVSTIGVKESEEALEIWRKGMERAIEEIEPSAALLWGGEIDFDFKGTKVVVYDNKVFDKYKE